MNRLASRSELEAREQELRRVLDQKDQHGIDVVRKAIAIGRQMGQQQIEISFLHDPAVVTAIRKEVTQAPYVTVVKTDLRQAVLKRLAPFVGKDKNATVSSQTMKEIALASATLGHLREIKHIIS